MCRLDLRLELELRRDLMPELRRDLLGLVEPYARSLGLGRVAVTTKLTFELQGKIRLDLVPDLELDSDLMLELLLWAHA